ncbi:MAG TPA: DMT family transporter [Noviherbaspirillum sp.]|nr:DMT family transporter [Noviherbaspirillum sp.]
MTGVLYGLAVALVWGAQPVVASFGYRAGFDAFDLTLLRFSAAGLIMLPLFLRSGVRDAGGLSWRRALILIVLAGPLYNMVLIGGLTWAPASHSSLIYPAFTPLFTALLARLMLDRQERIPVAGLALLLAGVLSIKLDGFMHPATGEPPGAWRGDLLFVCAALMWSFYTVLMRRWNTRPLAVVAAVQVGGLLYVPVHFGMRGMEPFALPTGPAAIQMLYQGVLVSVISVLLFNLAVRKLGAKASMFTALMPVVGVSLAVLLLGEPLTLSLIAGTALIVTGLLVSMRKRP